MDYEDLNDEIPSLLHLIKKYLGNFIEISLLFASGSFYQYDSCRKCDCTRDLFRESGKFLKKG